MRIAWMVPHDSTRRGPAPMYWASAASAVLEEEGITTKDLRIPGVERPWFAEVERQLFVEAEGFHARVVQHECDHLVGTLYPMRIKDFSRFGFTEVLFPGLDPNTDD